MPSEVKTGPIECLLAHADIGPREVVADALERIGMTVEVVGSIEECAQSLQRRQFDLIITSLKLADAEAWELERMVRGEDSCPPSMLIIVLCEASMYGHYLPIAQQRNCELIPEDDLSQLEQLVAQAITKRTRPSVLLIEDNRAQAQAARQALSDHFEIEVRHDGRLGLEAWRREHHQLVLLDLQLPTIDGARVLELIKQESPSQLILVVSGLLSKYRREKLLAAGATDVLPKPYPINDLSARCHHILHHGALKRAAAEVKEDRANRKKISHRLALAEETLLSGQSVLTKKLLREALDVCGPMEELTDDERTLVSAREEEWLKSSGLWAKGRQG